MYNIKVTKKEHLWNDDCHDRTKVLGEKPICMPLLPSKIPHGLPWDQTWTTTLRSQLMIASNLTCEMCIVVCYK